MFFRIFMFTFNRFFAKSKSYNMKIKQILFGASLLFGCSSLFAANIAKTTSAPAIDGSMDNAYRNSTIYKIEKTAVGNENHEVGQWRAVYDDTYFYFFVEIINANPWGNQGKEWDGDAVELYFRSAAGNANQLIFGYKSGTNVEPLLYSGNNYNDVMARMTTVNTSYNGVTKGYNVEVRVARVKYGLHQLQEGGSFYMELGADMSNSAHNGRQSQVATWNNSDQHYQNAGGYSQVSLIDPTKPVITAEGNKTKVCSTGGSFVSLSVESALSGDEVTFAWKKDGNPYSTGKGAGWNNIRPSVAGNYTCEVNVDGVVYRSNTITVTAGTDVCPDRTFESYLPIVLVNTNGQGFPGDKSQQAGIGPSIKAKRVVDVKILWDENGGLNNVQNTADTAKLHYDRKAIMNHRGSTSADMVKKPFAFRTCKKNLENGAAKKGNFPMLNMPEEKDWILYASYGDKSLMRNKLAMDLYYMMGYWQTDLRFVELFIDNEYRGIYLMMEKITRDKDRVALTKDQDTNTDPAACGYIWKLDKTDGGSTTWTRTTDNCGGSCGVGGCGDQSYYQPQRYELVYPEEDALNYDAKKNYIKTQVSNFEKALNAANDEAGFRNVFENYIDLQSFADYFIIAELAKCSDAYRVSVFFTKDVNGKIRLTPIWDFDMGFGNSTTHGSFDPYTWQYNANGVNETNFPIPFWWNKLRTSSCFNSVVRTRWHELRQAFFSNESIMARIDDMYNLIGKDLNGVGGTSPSSRNKSRWSWNTINDCGGYDCPWHVPSWPNDYPSGGKTTSLGSQEIPNMKEWIRRRLSWLDSQIDNDAFGSLLNDISSCTNQEETEPHYRTDIEEIAENGEINISAQDGVLSIEALTEGDEIENVEIVSVNGSVLFAAKAIKSQNYQVEVPQTGVIIVKVQTQMSSVTKMMFVE